MSDYIYRPPPPPPPTPSNSSGGSANRGGYDADSRRDSGGNRGNRGGGARSGGFSRGSGGIGGQWRDSGLGQQYQQFPQQQRQPHPLPHFPPAAHYNPAFVAQQQHQEQYQQYQRQPHQPYQNHYFNNNPIYASPQYQSPPAPPPPSQQQLHNPYLSYSQEHCQSQHPQFLPLKPPQQQQHPPFPAAGWPTHSSYGHFNSPPQPPPRKQQKREHDDKPDMDEATWLSLNGGKLIGTNIAPPETPEEIEAWIAQRKSRFPTAKKIGENLEKKQEVAARAEAEAKRVAAQQKKERDLKSHAIGGKRKRVTADTGDGDDAPLLLMGSDIDNDYDTNASNSDSDDDGAPPEITSSKVKSAVPEPAIQKPDRQGSKKSTGHCRDFLRGECAKGDRCRFRHEKEPVKKKDTKAEEKRTLYQRLVEHDREKENTLMLQVIQYLMDKGQLPEEIWPR
ncbi:hypothetical protein DFP73DRAFT_591256 [Morchella snyderi]|nr:hypothetical protein DFP73DRAFT_591256 [Morchella snyderi]